MHSSCPFDGADMRTGWFSCQSSLSLGGFSEVVVILLRAHSHAHERAFRANRHWFSEGSLRFSEVVVILIRTHSHARRLCSAIPAVSCNVLDYFGSKSADWFKFGKIGSRLVQIGPDCF